MTRLKLAPVFALLLALTLFFGGMLSYKLITGAGAKTAGAAALASKPSTRSEGIGIQGKVAIQVYSASGQLVASWKGHNSLSIYAKSAIAGCLSGATTAPYLFGSCGSEINSIIMCPSTGGACAEGNTTNSVLPASCDPTTGVPTVCTGWQSVATLNVLQTSSYNQASGQLHVGTDRLGFDLVTISPSLSLNQGDRAVVTITFTVT